jgi:hypothetical protein
VARIRTIKPAFFTSDQVCACSPLSRLLFIGLWCEADRDGRLHDKPNQIKFRVLPGDDCDVDALLWELVKNGLVARFEAPDPYIQILKFTDHQRPHPKEPPSAIRATGRELPWKETAGRDRVVMLPGEFPSSPVGREGKEISGREGDLGRVGKEAPPPARDGVASRVRALGIVTPAQFEREHGKHALRDVLCGEDGFVCLPQLLHDEWRRRLVNAGSSADAADSDIRAFVVAVKACWRASGEIPGDDNFAFWRHEWASAHGSNRPAPAGPDALTGVREALRRV